MTETPQFTIPAILSDTVTVPPNAPETEHLVWTIAEAVAERKAEDIVILRVTDVSYLADYFLISTGFSRTQVRAIADNIEDHIEKEHNKHPIHTEGRGENLWILQDYGDVLVHTFMPDEREFYNLEAFWGHAESVNLADIATILEIPGYPLEN